MRRIVRAEGTEHMTMPPSTERLQSIEVQGHQLAAVFHDAGTKQIVICCHGFRDSKAGPNRFFVRLARQLAAHSICALRFDQYGSGDAEGDFYDSSFNDWVATTQEIAARYRDDGYAVALLGQSMGGATVLVAAAALGSALVSVVAWVPDPSVDAFTPQGDYTEEGGQRVHTRYWREAHDAAIVRKFAAIVAPTLVFFATNDAYVSPENQQTLIAARQAHQHITLLPDHPHSAWTYDQAEVVIRETQEFFVAHFSRTRTRTCEYDAPI